MWKKITGFFSRRPAYKPGPPPPPHLVMTEPCAAALAACMEPEIRQGHEGVAYLLGQSDGTTTVAVAAVRPQARTTRGSFAVASPAVANIVRIAMKAGLQLVGQVHTHPGQAYHSDGDIEGARIAYSGYVSLVLPDYGRHLPAFDGAAAYMYRDKKFIPLDPPHITVVRGRLS